MQYWDELVLLENLVMDGKIKLDRGRVISSIDLMNYPGDYPVYSSSAQKNGLFGYYDLYDFDEELITWSVDGGGYFFYRPKHKFSVTNVSGIMRINDTNKINYKFLYYLLVYQHKNQIFDYVDKAHPSVIKKRYFIPNICISEQAQIAKILSKIDEVIDQTKQLIAKNNRIKSGLMQDLLTKGLDKSGNIRSGETHEFKDSALGKIPKEWVVRKLSELCNKIVDCPHSTPDYLKDGILVARTQNIKNGRYLIDSSSYVSEDGYKDRTLRLVPRTGDVIFTREAPIGEAFVIPDKMKICLGQRVMLFRVNIEKLKPEFLVELIYSENVKIMFDGITGGTTVSHLNVKDIKNLNFTVPSVEEQTLILNQLTKSKSLINSFHLELLKLQSIKTGLMQDLLTGKVRVTDLKIEETDAV